MAGAWDSHEIGGVTRAEESRDMGASYLAKVRAGETRPHEFMLRILAYIETRDYFATSAGELAPGVVAVADSYGSGEVDLFFDPTKWCFTDPLLWIRPGEPESSCLVTDGLGNLQGIGGGVRSLGAAMSFAKRNLTALEPTTWHEAPKLLF